MCTFRSEEQRLKIEKLEVDLARVNDEECNLKDDNRFIMKQCNVCCQIVKRLYAKITQLYLNYNVSKEMHRKMLPFL